MEIHKHSPGISVQYYSDLVYIHAIDDRKK